MHTSTQQATGPLSFAQEQLWFLDQLAPGTTTYTIALVWRLRGPLRVDLLHRAVDLVVARHAALRVTIHDDDGTPYQVVAPPAGVPLPLTDLGALPAAERERRVEEEIEALRAEPYDLAAGPLCRFRLLRLSADEHVFCQGFHHAVTDGWSAAVINAELSTAYRSLLAGTGPVFGDRELDFPEFAAAQRGRLRGDALTEELGYWQRHLADLPVLELPADRPRSAGGDGNGETLVRDFPADLPAVIGRLAGVAGASAFMVLAAAFDVVLSRYSGLVDIPIGVPMLGRPDPELEAVVGMFVTMVVLRTDLSGDPTFAELVDRVADGSLELYDHQEVSFHQVVDVVQPVRSPGRNPLFQVSLQLLGGSNSGESLDLTGVSAEFVPLTSLRSRFDVALNVVDTGSALRAAVEYSSDMFDRWRIEAMLGHLETVLRAAAADPDLRLSQLPIVSVAEAERLLAAGRSAGGQVYVVDGAMHLVPRGVVGQLAESTGPAAGGRPLACWPERQARHTGALARWTADLRLERLDRADPGAPGDPAPAAAGGELRTHTERTVADIFGVVLSLPATPGGDESFFDIGGNSLQAMRAVSRINKSFGIKLGVRTLYGNGTVRAVSAAVDETVGARA